MPKDKEKEKEEKERKAREKQAAKEAKEREKAEAKEAKEREKAAEKAAALAAKEREKEAKEQAALAKEREKQEKLHHKGGEKPSTPQPSSPSDKSMGDRSGSAKQLGAFNRRSMHGKKEPERRGSGPLAVASPPVAQPPSAIEMIQKAHLGAPLVRKEHQGSSRFRPNNAPQLEKLQSLQACKATERHDLFIKKLRQCANIYNFDDATADVKSKDIKRLALEEMLQLLRSPDHSRNLLTEVAHEEMCVMFTANAFRVLSPPSVINGADYDPEEDEPVLEPSWPHLQGVYDLFCLFLEHNEFNQAIGRKFIDTTFAGRLLDLFDSEDPRERDLLKSILHRVYGKIVPLRGHIRRCINDIFQRFVYEPPGKFNGIAELLEILGSIINGFALPLKEEHKGFLHKALMPLHKAKSLALFHQQLLFCVVQFVEKDVGLANSIVHSLLHMWPRTHSPKEVMFLNELEDIVSVLGPQDFSKIHEVFFHRLARSVSSNHFQVAERALYFFNSEIILDFVRTFAPLAVPILFNALSSKARQHWNRNINTLLLTSLKKLMDVDEPLFQQCAQAHKQELAQQSAKQQDRQSQWQRLEQMAQRNPLSRSVEIFHPTEHLSPSPVAASEDVFEAGVVSELQRLNVDVDPRAIKNGKMRRKSFLPQDAEVQQAILAHTPHGLPTNNL